MGSLEVVTGCMFSGKTEELLRRLKRVALAKKTFLLFKPAIDTRYSETEVVSHNGMKLKCISVPTHTTEHALRSYGDPEVWAFDEAQFFSREFISICSSLVKQGKRVLVAGLDLNFKEEPFGSMPQLMALADKVDKLTAICKCGAEATRTQRVFSGSPVTNGREIVIGGEGTYEARCKGCFRHA